MSYRAPVGSYTPPPPPPAVVRRSPWLFVGIGCGVLALSLLSLIGYTTYIVGTEIKKPFTKADETALIRDVKDIPRYPGSTLDKEMTQAQRGGNRLSQILSHDLDADKVITWADWTEEPASEVQYWYDKVMPSQGYHAMTYPTMGEVRPLFYRRGKDAVLVVATPRRTEAGTSIVMMKMVGLKDDLGDEGDAGAPPVISIPVGQGAVGTIEKAPPPVTKPTASPASAKPTASPGSQRK